VPAGGRVKIVSSLEAENSRIRVIDDGPGIPAREAERIFDPFYRVSDKLTDGVSGTGLGLGIARDLARLHGGDLVLLPSERGACFELSLHTPAFVNGEGS
jgi:signal transduction histidine kinase